MCIRDSLIIEQLKIYGQDVFYLPRKLANKDTIFGEDPASSFDDSYIIEGSEDMTNREFFNSFLAYNPHDSVELKLRHYLGIEQDDYIWEKLVWLGIFEDKKIGLKNATPAQMLQKILKDKWSLSEDDKDMLVMYHEFDFEHNGKAKKIVSSMINIGEDQTYTAMANTVGLPIAIGAKMILNGALKAKGVTLPINKDIYEPILSELSTHGIVFNEEELEIQQHV